MTEEKLVHQFATVRTRSLLWGIFCGATAVTVLGLILLRPIQISVYDQPVTPVDEPVAGSDPLTRRDAVGEPPDELLDEPLVDEPLGEAISEPTENEPNASLAPEQVSTAGLPSNMAGAVDVPGRLRVSNQTRHAVRIALLPQLGQGDAGASPVDGDAVTRSPADAEFSEPVHWDFAPEEGGVSGLLLSLPNGGQSIQQGDVLVAFAQDGSQRYWGPYVVGVTALPVWRGEAGEWQLTLQSPSGAAASQ